MTATTVENASPMQQTSLPTDSLNRHLNEEHEGVTPFPVLFEDRSLPMYDTLDHDITDFNSHSTGQTASSLSQPCIIQISHDPLFTESDVRANPAETRIMNMLLEIDNTLKKLTETVTELSATVTTLLKNRESK